MLHLILALGSTIYARVMVDPVQNLGDSFSCGIEKVFLCTGADGYVPKYNPTYQEYGCLADSPSLLYRFKILVRCDHIVKTRNDGEVISDFCLLFCRTKPSRRLKLQRLVM